MTVEERVIEILREIGIAPGEDITDEQLKLLVKIYKVRYAEMFALYGDEIAETSASNLVRFVASDMAFNREE